MRTGDGREANIPYTWQPLGPGVYQPTPPGSSQYVPVTPWLAQFLPFSFSSPSQFRAPAPPLLTSSTYTSDFNEVKIYGSLDSSNTTPEQREIARFFTENPVVFIPRNIRLFAASQSFSLSESARFFAQIFIAESDAWISGWDSKYFYNFWRPSTAIRNADIDGNPLTEIDTLWQPLVATPRHPEYVGGHGFVAGAIAYTIEKFFGTQNIPFTFTSTVTGTQHNYTNINDYLTETADARVYGGMHFRSSMQAGIQMGQSVAYHVADQFFPVVAQFNAPDLEGFYRGIRVNYTFGTTDSAFITIDIDESTSSIQMIWDMDGVVFGVTNPAPAIMTGTYDDGGFSVQGNSSPYGDMFFTGLANGTITGRFPNVNYQVADSMTFDGTYNQDSIHLPYIAYYGGSVFVTGVVNVWKDPSPTDVTTNEEIPATFQLMQNYPNPFNPSTVISWQLPVSSHVSIKVYDILGNEVATLVDEFKEAGNHSVKFNASGLSSGIYFYKLQAEAFSQTKKLLLMK
jgi:hypothetical protein